MVNKNIHLFLIPMPFCTFLCFRTFVLSFESSCMPFFLNFFIQAPLSIVSFCVRDVSTFSSRTEKNFRRFSTYGSTFVLRYNAFHRSFRLLSTFWHSIPGMGSFAYNVMFTLIPFMGPLMSLPRTF